MTYTSYSHQDPAHRQPIKQSRECSCIHSHWPLRCLSVVTLDKQEWIPQSFSLFGNCSHQTRRDSNLAAKFRATVTRCNRLSEVQKSWVSEYLQAFYKRFNKRTDKRALGRKREVFREFLDLQGRCVHLKTSISILALLVVINTDCIKASYTISSLSSTPRNDHMSVNAAYCDL